MFPERKSSSKKGFQPARKEKERKLWGKGRFVCKRTLRRQKTVWGRKLKRFEKKRGQPRRGKRKAKGKRLGPGEWENELQ